MFGRALGGFAEVVSEWEGFEHYGSHLEALKTNYLAKVLKTYKPNRNEFGFNVLNHADFHVRNVLFKNDNAGNMVDFKFVSSSKALSLKAHLTIFIQIDYQICNYATPAIDLIYALYYFLSSENRQTRRAEFITSYYNQFVSSLKQFGYMKAPPSLMDLQVELLRNGNLEVILAVCNSVFFYFDVSTMTAEDFDMGEGTKRAYKRIYNIPEYKTMIQKELPRFLHNGFI